MLELPQPVGNDAADFSCEAVIEPVRQLKDQGLRAMLRLSAAASRSNAALELFDANLELWNSLCDVDPGLNIMRDFARGPLATFLNPELYSANWSGRIPDAKRRIARLEEQAHHYLAGNGLESELETMLSRHANEIARHAPETVAFSVMYPEQLPFALAQAKYLRAASGPPVAFGGAAMSAISPVELLEAAPYVDLILTGEGEIAFMALLDGCDAAHIPGCYHREANGGIRHTGAIAFPQDLSLLPRPNFGPLMPNGYFNPLPVMPVYGCRGCRWRRCRFCVHNNSFGRYRQRPPALLAQDMLEYGAFFGCRHFYIVDQYVDPFYLNELCDAILAIGLECRFQIMARTIPAYTPELLHKAAQAGCCWISWGMESGSQKLLDLMNKGTTPDSSLEVIKNAADAGISNLLMMIFGAPGSDDACLNETFAFLDRAWPYIDGMTASAFVLFGQTGFSSSPQKYGLEILGGNRMLKLEHGELHDMKLRFRRDSEPGRSESPLAAIEVEKWERRKIWLPPLPFHGRLCCEHYLLYADAVQADTRPGSDSHSA